MGALGFLFPKIEGAAGVIAPLVGKQPPDIRVWIVKSEAPTFVEFEGPLFRKPGVADRNYGAGAGLA